MDIRWWMSQIWRDAAAFGIPNAISNLRRVIRSPCTTVSIPGHSAIHIRPFNSDYATIYQTFGEKEYALNVPSAQQRLNDSYDSILARGRIPIIIDAGANIGAASLWFRAIYPRAQIVAIEPDADNVRLLEMNIGQDQQVVICEAALGSAPGYVKVIRGSESWASTTKRADDGLKIITVDEAVSLVPQGEPFLIKMDIEGFEKEVFSSDTDWVGRFSGVFVEPHDWLYPGKRTSQNLQKVMSQYDFELFLNGENIIYVSSKE